MPQKNPPRCNCKDCVKMRKQGMKLHQRIETRRFDGPMFVSDYVPDQKYKSGRARKEREPEIELEDVR